MLYDFEPLLKEEARASVSITDGKWIATAVNLEDKDTE